ncbi:mCG148062 [Mus musculus]|nr:mCG148062 [Mus musculus]
MTVLLNLRFLPLSFYICLSLYKKLQVFLCRGLLLIKQLGVKRPNHFGCEAVGILVEEKIPCF